MSKIIRTRHSLCFSHLLILTSICFYHPNRLRNRNAFDVIFRFINEYYNTINVFTLKLVFLLFLDNRHLQLKFIIMNPKSPEARIRDDNPFEGMYISGSESLDNLNSRSACPRCGKSRMYFCYTCFVPVTLLESKIPHCRVRVQLILQLSY